MNKGTVKWFNNEKGFGFIKGEDDKDVFVHQSSIKAEGYRSLEEGESVSYEIETDQRGAKAINVIKL